jgi:two-component system sensor histidine kinase/response regulator
MSDPLRILVIEDDPADFLLLQRQLERQGVQARCTRVASTAELDAALQDEWDLVLSDYSVPGMDFRASLRRMQERQPDLPVILVSGSVGEESAVELLHLGLSDYLLKDNLARLPSAIERTMNEVSERHARRVAEAALAASEAKYRLLAEHSESCIFWLGADGHYRYVSPACQALSGYPPEDFLAAPALMENLLHEDDRTAYRDHLAHAEQSDEGEQQYRIVRKDGELRSILHQCKPMYDDDGTFLGRRGTNRDITARVKAEREMERERGAFIAEQRQARIAALNMMEDSVNARQRAEAAMDALR